MLTVFSDYCRVVHYELLLLGQIINKEYYLSLCFSCVKLFVWNNWNYMRTTLGSFIMVIHHVILHRFFTTFLPKTWLILFRNHHIWFGPIQLLAIQQTQKANAEMLFWHNWGDKNQVEEDLEDYTGKRYTFSYCLEDWKKRWKNVFYRTGITLKGMKLIWKYK